jgi:hypothetical protein
MSDPVKRLRELALNGKLTLPIEQEIALDELLCTAADALEAAESAKEMKALYWAERVKVVESEVRELLRERHVLSKEVSELKAKLGRMK